MKVITLHSVERDRLDRPTLTHAHWDGDAHLMTFGLGGDTIVATTAELAEWITELEALLGRCRVADMRRAMPHLDEVQS